MAQIRIGDIIHCRDEKDMESLYWSFAERGYICKKDLENMALIITERPMFEPSGVTK